MDQLLHALRESKKAYTEKGFYVIEEQPDGGTFRVYPTERAKERGSTVEGITDERVAIETALKLEDEVIKQKLGF